jgi:hypothetical protein
MPFKVVACLGLEMDGNFMVNIIYIDYAFISIKQLTDRNK